MAQWTITSWKEGVIIFVKGTFSEKGIVVRLLIAFLCLKVVAKMNNL